MSKRENILRIKAVHAALGDLGDQVVFVGGATVSLYTDRPSSEVRPTDDVDVLVELLDYGEYSALEEKLHNLGFRNDVESGVICRYRVQGLVVDVMPASENILGFSNKWYPEAFAKSFQIILDGQITIKLFTPPYFIATKLEAFKGRGGNDGRTSTDFEDIIYILNNRTKIWEELQRTSEELRSYLKEEFRVLLEVPYIEEWISANLEHYEQGRSNFIINSLTEFSKSA